MNDTVEALDERITRTRADLAALEAWRAAIRRRIQPRHCRSICHVCGWFADRRVAGRWLCDHCASAEDTTS